MKRKPNTTAHNNMAENLSGMMVKRAIIILVFTFVIAGNLKAADIVLTDPQQDGYTNDHEYNITDPVLLCGTKGYVAVMEFPVLPGIKIKKARLTLHVIKVKKPGQVVLYHLENFNNGYAETQDFYAAAGKLGQAEVEKPGEIVFDVTKTVKKDAQGPGGFTSYRLEGRGAELVLSAYESGKDKSAIKIE